MEFVFLHTPKTGGNYVIAALDGITTEANHEVYADSNWVLPQDYPPSGAYLTYWFNFAIKDINLLKQPNTICFATVRNPFDWLVSFYHVVPYGIGITSFADFVETIADRDSDWPSRKFIYFQFFSYQGEFLVDRLLYQDVLNDEIEIFANEFDELVYTPTERQKVSEKRKYVDYRFYYTDRLVDIVLKTWSRELWLYGYDFEGKTKGFLDNLTQETKQAVRYLWDADMLYINRENYDGQIIGDRCKWSSW